MIRHLLPIPLLLAAGTACAQAPVPKLTLEALAARVAQLEQQLAEREPAPASAENEALKQRVAILERQLELQDEATTSAKASAPVFTVNDKGVAAKSADGAYEF